MALADDTALIAAITAQLGATSAYLTEGGFNAAVLAVTSETGFSLPLDNALGEYWMVERGKRHALFILMIESAHKFRFKDKHVHQRFAHYEKIIAMMDELFTTAVDDNPDLFPGSGGVLTSDGEAFMKLIGPGFVYEDGTGIELTYLTDV